MIDLSLNHYVITINETNGAITNIRDTEHNLSLHGSIWKIEKSDLSVLTLDDMSVFHYSASEHLELQWEKADIRVKIRFLEEQNKLKMHISAVTGNETIRRIHFPVYEGIEKISENDDYLVLPYQNGFLIRNPIDNLLNTEAEVPFWMGRGGMKYENDYPAQYSYQFFAYYQTNTKGYYMACEDGQSYIKTIGLHYNEALNGMDMIFTNYPEGMSEISYYTLPYQYAFGFFRGDWQTAAKIYRSWAVRQKWYAPLHDRKVSSSIKEIDFFRINHEHYALGTRTEEFIKTCSIIKEKLACKPAMHWYGWNKAPKHGDWYPEMADYHNEAWHTELLETNRRLTDMDIPKIPYVNVHLWDSFLQSFEQEDAPKRLVVQEGNRIADEPWSADRNLFAICHSDNRFKNKALALFDRLLREDGFDGIYIDQVASFNATLCYSKSHGHPVGGGSWWADEYHRMLSTLRAIMPENKFITTESCCECYHDLFDLFLILDTCSQSFGFYEICGSDNCDSIPLFAMIYNDSAISYGSVCTFSNNTKRFEFNFTRNILWGMIPTCEGMELAEIENDSEKWEIITRGVDFYRANREILLYGTYEEYIEKTGCNVEITFNTLSKKCPGVIGSVYFYDQKRYLFAYNYSEEKQTLTTAGQNMTIEPGVFFTAILP